MRLRRVVLLLVAICACQRPAQQLDIDVVPVAKSPEPVDVAPSLGSRTAIEPPRLSATSTVNREPSTAMVPSEVLSITIAVDVIGATGQSLALELTAPDGTMYQRLLQPLDADPWVTQHRDFTVPIAGTWIDSMALTGTWNARLFAGPAELLTDTFELVP